MTIETITPVYTLRVPSPVGELLLTATRDGLLGVHFSAQGAPRVVDNPAPDHPMLSLAARELGEYFAGERRVFEVPSAVTGTAFQQAVWSTLRAIPFGTTVTYRQVASAVGLPMAVRAVGACNSRNPLLILVPCHRVVGTSGALIGYSGGIDAKRWLLDHERRVAAPGS